MILESSLQVVKNKNYIKSQVQQLCDKLQIPSVIIKYDKLQSLDAVVNPSENTIIFNIDLLEGNGIYKFYPWKDRQLVLKSTIYHEMDHLKQYQECINFMNPITLGSNHVTIKNKTNYPYSNMSLYIKPHKNMFLNSVYTLQPNEYRAFSKGISILKEELQKVETSNLDSRVHTIDKAVNFLNHYFDTNNMIQEISNALMNLYDDGNRPCSEGIQDLVIRCAICSYEDEEDYGIDKVSLLLGENYVQSLENNRLLHQKDCSIER